MFGNEFNGVKDQKVMICRSKLICVGAYGPKI